MDRRTAEAAAAPQADAVRRTHAAGQSEDDLRTRRPRLGRWTDRRSAHGTAAVSEPFEQLVDLASERLGATVVAANDDFFAPKENLIKSAAPLWIEGRYTDRGKWMDGWETRRRRDDGTHDWCVVRLGARGIVRALDVDTTHFKGNYPESAAVDAAADVPSGFVATADWTQILPRMPLKGDSHNRFDVEAAVEATHLRLRIFPDGGVARLRALGAVVADWNQ